MAPKRKLKCTEINIGNSNYADDDGDDDGDDDVD